MAVRLKDIAQDLGLSIVTISKVLRNHDDISSETRERVLKRMKELNYQPNLAARALVTGRSHLIGLVVPDLVHPFFAQVAKGVSRELRNRGYGLVIASSEEDPELEKQEIRQMLARRLDALLIASAQRSAETFRSIEEHRNPYVLIDRRLSGLAAHFVGTDDVAVGSMATDHLIENGCQRIAYIGGEHVSTAVDRLEGYRRALAGARTVYEEKYVVCRPHVDDSADLTGYEAMKELLSLATPPDGVFCFNDPIAMGAMEAALEAGMRVPEDLAIVGCGNVRYGAALRVPLTTVDQGSDSLGECAAKLALSLIQSKNSVSPKQVLIEPKLVVRESSMRGGAQSCKSGASRNSAEPERRKGAL
ncbi:MAG: LacI family transcriptional regulator [Acidobacteriota bacterium]|nr:LacI family transcriptional regulator [Acidobacteriota bacterium]